MPHPLMPKATAVWLVENTPLTFRQIADFCGLHELEIQGIADGEVAVGMKGLDPVANGQITKEELERCVADADARLHMLVPDLPLPKPRSKGPRYTPIAKRQDKPDAIAWMIRHYPMLSDAQISKLLGTTKSTIAKVRDRSHWNHANIRPRSPVVLGLCGQPDIDEAVAKTGKTVDHPIPHHEPDPVEPPPPTRVQEQQLDIAKIFGARPGSAG